MKKWLKKYRNPLIYLLIIFMVHVIVIVSYGFSSKGKKSDYIFILGNKVEETGIPSKRLQYRLNKGLELFQAGKAPKIIVSGGVGKEGFDEAEVMAQYLIDHGVDADEIIKDNQGLTTFASAQNCVEILAGDTTQSVLIVSQYFHLLRARIAFEKAGMEKVTYRKCGLFLGVAGCVFGDSGDSWVRWSDLAGQFRIGITVHGQ